MPNITRVNIADRIGDILDTISSSVFPSKYRYLESSPASYPALMLKYGGASSEMLDTVSDLVTYTFDIVLVFENDESAAAQTKWQNAYDTVMATLNDSDNQTLSGDAVSFRVDQDLKPAATTQFERPVIVLGIRTLTKVVQSI